MIKLILFFCIFTLLLDARENPFFNHNKENMPITANDSIALPTLKNASLTFPSTAREIQSVSVKYKNLDGSLSIKKIQLNNSIDWHLPLFISQSYTEVPTKRTSKRIKKAYRKIDSFGFISFYIKDKRLKVRTKDTMIRNFMLVHPHRIVFDMKKNIDIKSHIKKLRKQSVFTKIRIGNHNGYYRVVVELDGYYSYKLKKDVGTYIFYLR